MPTIGTTLITLTGCAMLALAGCADSTTGTATSARGTVTGDSASGASPDAGDTSAATVDITIAGDEVTPNGDRVDVGAGEPVTLHITSDRAGELHVHSDPEQHIEYGKGETTARVTIDRPGIVDIEDHAAEVVVVQLQVS
jgi:hypothetical protein